MTTLKQLEKKLKERRIVLTVNFLVRKEKFYVQATRWKSPVTKCEHPDLEVAVTAVLDAVKPFVPMTKEQRAKAITNGKLKAFEDEYFGGKGASDDDEI